MTTPTPARVEHSLVEFATPLSHDEERIDVYHDGEPLRYRTMEDLIGDQPVPEQQKIANCTTYPITRCSSFFGLLEEEQTKITNHDKMYCFFIIFLRSDYTKMFDSQKCTKVNDKSLFIFLSNMKYI
jgi:hypothetical protein